MHIPFKRLVLSEVCKEKVRDCLDSGMIGLGSEVFNFEKELAHYTGFKYAVCTDSCTSALFLSLLYERSPILKNKATIPSMTVPLVADAVLEAGYELEFDDRVDWVGDCYPILGTSVVDSAHKLERNMREDFEECENVCLSFYPTKNIGSADGGAILTDNEDFADWARIKATYGRNQKQEYRNSWDYDIITSGYKRHYTNLQAVICLQQLKELDKTNTKRKQILKKYNNAFGLKNISLYLYRINVDKRDEFISYMKDKGIECGVHFKPLHTMTTFKDYKVENPHFIESIYKRTVSLPFYASMTDDEVDFVIEAVKGFNE